VSSVYWLARTGVAIAGKTPRSVRYSLASTLSSASYLAWQSKRIVTQQNMAKVLGLPVRDPRVKRAAFESWSKYGRTASDLIYFPHFNMDDVEAHLVDMSQGASWQEYVRQALEPGKGAMIASAHFGSWDLAGAMLARYFPMFGIAETFKDPRMDDLIQGARRKNKLGIIPMENSARRILQELHNNSLVALAVDRPMDREKGVEVTFFGNTTYVPGGPAALTLKAGAAVLPGFLWYGPDHHFCIRAFPPMFSQPVRAPEERAQEIKRLTQYMYDCMEEVVREWPTQWFMFRAFWPADAVGTEVAEQK